MDSPGGANGDGSKWNDTSSTITASSHATVEEIRQPGSCRGSVLQLWPARPLLKLNPKFWQGEIKLNDLVALECTPKGAVGGGPKPQFDPTPLDLANPPGSMTVTTSGCYSSQYGMPLVQYLDSNGNLVSQQQATYLSDDGSTFQSPTPDLSNIVPGVYVGIAYKVNASGGLDMIDVGTVVVIDTSGGDPCANFCLCSPC